MTSYLQQLADLTVPAFVVSTMLAAGMSQRLADVVAPLRRPLPVVLALLANFVLWDYLYIKCNDFPVEALTSSLRTFFYVEKERREFLSIERETLPLDWAGEAWRRQQDSPHRKLVLVP